MRKKVLLVAPTKRNGGITSWTKNYLRVLPQEEYELISVSSDPKRGEGTPSLIKRITSGLSAMWNVMKDVRKVIKKEPIDILHKTTSGSLGALADWVLGSYCRKRNIKTIMHCHYGCIPETLGGRSLIGWLTRKSMQPYDQIWVLDKRTYQFLREREVSKAEIILTPNCIHVESHVDIPPKSYTNVAFIGNLYETKGTLELIEAIKQLPDEITLHMVGNGTEIEKQHIREHAGALLGNRIKCYGRLPNKEAVEFMNRMDILALPTYYPFEAFPISILEAMSLGKLVLSTRRAAIGDMLTTEDGRNCGLFVREKNIDDIAEAITWAYNHKSEADTLCELAYQKVYNQYRTEIVFQLYLECYAKLLNTHAS